MAVVVQPQSDPHREEGQISFDRLFLPDSVIATKPSHAGSWLCGNDRSIHHDSWQVATSDPDKVRTRDGPEIRFDANISYGGLLLSDPSLEFDKFTKKVICLRALTFGVIRNPIGSLSLYRLCLTYDWYLRWRIGKTIACNQDVDSDGFDAFVNQLSKGDVLSLVPIKDRLKQLTSDVDSGCIEFPVIRFNEYDNLSIDWIKLAKSLGVTRNSLSSSLMVRLALREMIPRIVPAVADQLLSSLVMKTSGRADSEQSSRKYEDFLLPWDYLYRLSETGWLPHDPLLFNPFSEMPLTKVAEGIGRAAERTLTLHPEDFGNLLAAASKWIISYADYLIHYIDTVRAFKVGGSFYIRQSALETLESRLLAKAPAGCPTIATRWTRQGFEGTPSTLSLNEAIRHLLTAAGIVIACLAARRRIEVGSLKAGCISETTPGVFTLATYIAKNLRDVDKMPVPALVAKAVEVLERLSADTRAKTKEAWLFQVHGFKGKAVPIEWSDALNGFAELMTLPLPKNMTAWSLTFHQLRRGFAVFYYYGNQFSSLDALSHMLWHLDPGETRHYVFESVRGALLQFREDITLRRRNGLQSLTDDERTALEDDRKRLENLEFVGEAWEEVRCEAFAHRLLQMWTGHDRAIGKGAKQLFGALKPLTEDLTEAVRVGPRSNKEDAEIELFVSRAKDWARENMLEPVPGVPVHCTCRHDHPDDLEAAECLKSKREFPGPFAVEASKTDRMPDMAYASTYVCLKCSHCAAFEDNRDKIQTTLSRLLDAVGKRASPALEEDAKSSHSKLAAALAEAENAVAEVGSGNHLV